MRGVPIAVFGSSFLYLSLLASSKAHPDEQRSDNVEPESNPLLAQEEIIEPRVLRRNTPIIGVTENRLKADGFFKDNHAHSFLEHDLTSKLQAIYERYYELTDKLQQAEEHSSELTKQLMQTKLDLANYKVYKNDLLNRLKKTEMYLTVLLKKSQYHIEEHEVDLNPEVSEELFKKNLVVGEIASKQDPESRLAAVTNGNVKEGINGEEAPNNRAHLRFNDTFIVKPHLDRKPHVASAGDVGKAIPKESVTRTPSRETSGITARDILEPQRNQTINNGKTEEDVLAHIAFSLQKKRTKPVIPEGPTLRGAFFDRPPERVGKPSGPIEKNVTVVLRAATRRKDSKGSSLADWNFGPGIGNMGFKIFESDSEDNHHTNIQYRRGEPGSAGTPGIPGTPGSSGPAGPAGKDGTVGGAGGAGQKGEPGMGVAGINGVNGVPGVQGAPGFPGTSGAPGANGDKGVKGSLGVQGPSGAKGIKGMVGEVG